MNRQKFEVRDKENNCFFEPTYEAYRWVLEELLMNQDGSLMLRTMSGVTHESVFPDRFEVMKRTWLNDKHGTPIYEWYIVKFNDNELHIVEFHDWCFCAVSIWWEWPENKGKVYAYRRYREWFWVPEIVWNNRQHPELLSTH